MTSSSSTLRALLGLVVALICAATATGGLLPQEVYWKTVLPKTPMPAILQHLLHADVRIPYSLNDQPVISPKANLAWRPPRPPTMALNKQRDLPVISPKANLAWRPPRPPTVALNMQKDLPVVSPKANLAWRPPRPPTMALSMQRDLPVVSPKANLAWRPPRPPTVAHNNQKDLPVISSGANYKWIPSPVALNNQRDPAVKHDETMHKHAANVGDYILHRNLHPGWKMTLHVLKTTARSGFLPRDEADSLPFSSSDLTKILALFSVNPDSAEATVIKSNLEVCGELASLGETRLCATSLESMVEFAITTLGTFDVKAETSSAVKEISRKEQSYTIVDVRRMGGGKAVVCHPVTYPYAVYFCHLTDDTQAFKVLAAGEDGTLLDAIVICHMDTTMTSPTHPSLVALDEKPGVAMCHFNPEDNVVWVPSEGILQMKNEGVALSRNA